MIRNSTAGNIATKTVWNYMNFILFFADIRLQLNEQLRCLDIRVESQISLIQELQEFYRLVFHSWIFLVNYAHKKNFITQTTRWSWIRLQQESRKVGEEPSVATQGTEAKSSRTMANVFELRLLATGKSLNKFYLNIKLNKKNLFLFHSWFNKPKVWLVIMQRYRKFIRLN